jgi:hypothetical protein
MTQRAEIPASNLFICIASSLKAARWPQLLPLSGGVSRFEQLRPFSREFVE